MQHDAILGNFDFQYVSGFFAPEKVEGRGYRPLR